MRRYMLRCENRPQSRPYGLDSDGSSRAKTTSRLGSPLAGARDSPEAPPDASANRAPLRTREYGTCRRALDDDLRRGSGVVDRIDRIEGISSASRTSRQCGSRNRRLAERDTQSPRVPREVGPVRPRGQRHGGIERSISERPASATPRTACADPAGLERTSPPKARAHGRAISRLIVAGTGRRQDRHRIASASRRVAANDRQVADRWRSRARSVVANPCVTAAYLIGRDGRRTLPRH